MRHNHSLNRSTRIANLTANTSSSTVLAELTGLRRTHPDALPRLHAMLPATLAVIKSCRLPKALVCSVLPSVSGMRTQTLGCCSRCIVAHKPTFVKVLPQLVRYVAEPSQLVLDLNLNLSANCLHHLFLCEQQLSVLSKSQKLA